MNMNLLHKDILNRSLKNRYYSFYTIAFQRKYHAPRYQDPKTSRWLSTDPGMTATRSEIGNSAAAQKMITNAAISPKYKFALAQVPITVNGQESSHWVGVNGLTDLNNDGETWLQVSPTSKNDGSNRAKTNSNWQQGSDGNMYVKFSAVQGAVVVE